MSDDLFGAVYAAAANNKSDNFRDGEGVCVIEAVKSFNGNDGKVFVVQARIVESKAKGDLTLSADQKSAPGPGVVQPNAVGSVVGWPQKVSKFKSAMGNVKSFILALFGKDEKEITLDEFSKTGNAIVNEDPKNGMVNPAKGMLIAFSTYRQVTASGPNKGNINTYVKWSHVKQTGAEIAARRAELGG